MKKSNKAIEIKLKKTWGERLNLLEEANKLEEEANKIYGEALDLKFKANALWRSKLISLCGNDNVEWEYSPEKKISACTLENGMRFEP